MNGGKLTTLDFEDEMDEYDANDPGALFQRMAEL